MRLKLLKLLNAGNVLKATPEKSGYCPRCRHDVRTIRPWAHWRKVRYGYFAVLSVAVLGSPVILVDGFVLIPSLMVFIAAIGPLNSLVAKQPTCAQCGSPAEKLRTLRLVASQRAEPDRTKKRERKHGPGAGK